MLVSDQYVLVTSGKALASAVATKSRHLSYSSLVSHSLHVVRPSLNLARSCLSYDACTSDGTPSGMLYSNHGQNLLHRVLLSQCFYPSHFIAVFLY